MGKTIRKEIPKTKGKSTKMKPAKPVKHKNKGYDES